MLARPTILCPTDFSDASRGALRYARVIAEHFGSRLVIMSVEDPLLTEAVDLGTGVVWDPQETRRELARFAERTYDGEALHGVELEYQVAVGKPANEILRIATERGCDLIVMSTHGLTGVRKLFFGSTTERVLRETTVPVLLTPATEEGPRNLPDVVRSVRRILVPVDLSSSSLHQVHVASGLAQALAVPLVVTYVLEPVRTPLAARLHLPGVDLERRTRAEDALGELLATTPRRLNPEALLAYGDPAEEISKVARDRQAGLIVIGLHGSPMLGPRMGSVTYRVLCLAPTLVLALPPVAVPVSDGRGQQAARPDERPETARQVV
jgi:nucleotide-binding universal stress UspA family protein